MTTIGIVLSLLFEAIRFFSLVPLWDFLFGLHWSPQTALREDQVGASGSFGAVPLFVGTALITFIVLGIRAASHFYLYPKFHAALTDREVKESNRMMTIIGTSTVDDWRSASMCGEEAVS